MMIVTITVSHNIIMFANPTDALLPAPTQLDYTLPPPPNQGHCYSYRINTEISSWKSKVREDG